VTDTPLAAAPARPARWSLASIVRGGLMPALLLTEIVVFGATAPGFLSASNFGNVVINASCLALLAAGMTFVILLGGIDVSVGPMLGVVAWIAATLSVGGLPPLLVVAISIAAGAVLGGVNGALVTFGRVPPIITTLGTSAVFATVLFLLWGSRDVFSPPILPFLGAQRIGGFPTVAIVLLVIYGAVFYLLRRRPWGRRLYAIGNDADGARLLGIRVRSITFSAYLLLGGIVGFAAVVYVGQYGAVQAASGASLTLLAIASVVVGGTSILGGEGGVLRTLGGVAFIVLAQNGVALLGLPPLWNGVLVGVALIVAVTVDLLARTLLTRGRRTTKKGATS
jgi:ribose/xylose/arabinose/galactoside ABC-type transport system permease subunit